MIFVSLWVLHIMFLHVQALPVTVFSNSTYILHKNAGFEDSLLW